MPFPLVSLNWYKRCGKLALKNGARRTLGSTETNGGLESDMIEIEKKMRETNKSSLRKKLEVILEVGEFFQKNGPLISAKDLGTLYKDKWLTLVGKSLRKAPKPTELMSSLSPHLSILQVNLNRTAFFVENRKQDVELLSTKIEELCNAQMNSSMRAHIEKKIGHIFNTTIAI